MTARSAETNLWPPGSPGTNSKEKCFYPNCRGPVIEFPDSYVTWDVHVPLQAIYDAFPPVVKLAIQENTNTNPDDPSRMLTFYLHPECAAEWGMHLIRDALEADDKVGRKLRSAQEREEQYNEF